MPLRPLPYRDVERKLRRARFVEVSQEGSHVKFAKVTADGTRVAIVPRHREVAVGTIRGICVQAGLTPEEFEAL